jgi:hypothetical protein
MRSVVRRRHRGPGRAVRKSWGIRVRPGLLRWTRGRRARPGRRRAAGRAPVKLLTRALDRLLPGTGRNRRPRGPAPAPVNPWAQPWTTPVPPHIIERHTPLRGEDIDLVRPYARLENRGVRPARRKVLVYAVRGVPLALPGPFVPTGVRGAEGAVAGRTAACPGSGAVAGAGAGLPSRRPGWGPRAPALRGMVAERAVGGPDRGVGARVAGGSR